MSKKYSKSIMIFRRDLRIIDNTALIEAHNNSESAYPIFILDPNLYNKTNKNHFANIFLFESLKDLDFALKGNLTILHGSPTDQLRKVIEEIQPKAIFFNKDYSPYSNRRDTAIITLAKNYNIDINIHNDSTLTQPGEITTNEGKPLKVFSQFYKKAVDIKINNPNYLEIENLQKIETYSSLNLGQVDNILSTSTLNSPLKGGRENGLRILYSIKNQIDYKSTRDFPSINTSQLSPHLKFGTLSIREVFHEIEKPFGKDHELLRQLYWRDFFIHLSFSYPYVFTRSFNSKFSNIKWEINDEYIRLWKKGLTGFPIVDAGIRELNQTGFMHNRLRMIVASFLVKDLLQNWQIGEKYFSEKLIDYDPAVNNGNWQWVAGTGADSAPYFRIFNPWLQQKKFDPDCIYIKKWIPELRNVDNKIIHKWDENYDESIYPKPIVAHDEQKKRIVKIYES